MPFLSRTRRLLVLAVLAAPRLCALNPAEDPANYIVHHWGTEDGLVQNTTKRFLQTRDGYIWIATAHGFSRFDGLTFTNFKYAEHPGLTSNNVMGFAETADGSVWIATAGGLTRYKDGVLTSENEPAKLSGVVVNAVTVAPDGSLWVGHRAGIVRWKDGKYFHDLNTREIDLFGLRDFFVADDGAIWIAAGNAVVVYRDGKFSRFSASEGLPPHGIQSVRQDPEGSIVTATQQGLFVLDGGRFRRFPHPLSNDRLTSVLTDSDGSLWIGSAGGLERWANGKLVPYVDAHGVPMSGVSALFEDRDKRVWVATSAGVYQLGDRRGHSLGRGEGVLGGLVLSLFETHDGSLWASSWSGGVARFHDSGVTQYRLNAPLSHDSVTCMRQAPDGTMWFGNRGSAIERWDGKTMRTYVYEQGLVSSRFVSAIHFEPDGEILFSIAQRGLFTIRDDKLVRLEGPDELGRAVVWWLGRLQDGRVVAASERGLYQRGRDGAWTLLPVPGFPPHLDVRGLLQDAEGCIWLATDAHGLIEWRGATARSYSMAHGMVDDTLSGLIDDGHGCLWVTSGRGISRVRREELVDFAAGRVARLNPITFGRSDGLRSGATQMGSGAPRAVRRMNGQLAFATDDGVALINPADVQVNVQPPTTVLEAVIAEDRSYVVPATRQVQLPAGTERFEIKYTAISMIAPQRLLFRYRLVGSDSTWVEAGRTRTAQYTHLAPGDYTFQLLACNSDGVWSKTPTSIQITVLPHFYQRLWFRALVVALVVGAVGGLVLLRIRKLKNRQLELARRNAELDQRVRERTAELSKSHAEIQQREILFRLIFEHAPVGISWSRTDLDGRYHFNTAFRRILNLTPDAVLDDAVLEQMTHPEDRPRRAEKESEIMQGKTDSYTIEQRFLRPGVEEASGLLAVAVVRDDGGRILQVIRILEDITPLKKAELELARTYERLVEASRKAGMAEVATGVLHNVGNVLNSVNVSATLLLDGFRQSRVTTLSKVAARVREQSALPGAFGPEDSNGQKVLEYLDTVTKHLASEQQRFVGELEGLRQNVEHINEVVARQQNYAELGGIEEVIAPRDVFEEAFRINSMSYTRHNIEVVREFPAVPKIVADRHKVLQILVNLLQNAKQAVEQNAALGRKIVLRLEEAEQSVRFIVADNGIGVAPENRARIFAHGFTTRSGGHGFGLHSSANAAKEMRGTLKMHSEGLGKGATFTLQLPVADEKALAKGVRRSP